jgi:hypothetical protein
MNLHNTSLGVFVPGRASTRSLRTPFNEQRGVGDFVPASFPIPQTPITLGDFVGGSFPVPFNPIAPSVASAGMGYFMDACFPVPQNPIADAAHVVPATAINGRGMGRIGCTSCGGTCGAQLNTRAVRPGGSGMGDVSTFVSEVTTGDWGDALMGQDLWSGIPNVVVVLGGTWIIASLIGDLFRVKRGVKTTYQVAKETKKQVKAAHLKAQLKQLEA